MKRYSAVDGLILDTDGDIAFVVNVCHNCGAVVCDIPAHDRLHEQLDQPVRKSWWQFRRK